MSFSAAVIGLGQIGMGYDYNNDNSMILTHSSAYSFHDSFSLIGGFDLDKNLCYDFEKKYNEPTFNNINELMSTMKPEVVSIAVPTQDHYDVFNQIIDYEPKAIVFEKPFTNSLNDAIKIVEKVNEKNCSLLVNYIRRFEPGTNKLKKIINRGDLGDIYKGIIWYTKGLFNSCSHFIDLLSYFFGDASNIEILNKGRIRKNFDPEPDFSIQFGNRTFFFIVGKEENFHFNEMELIGSRGRVRYIKGGEKIEYQLTIQDPKFYGYTILDNKCKRIKTDFNRYQYYVLDNLSNHLTNGLPLKSDGKTATKTLKIIEQIISKTKIT